MIIVNSNIIYGQTKMVLYIDPVHCLKRMRWKTPMTNSRSEGDANFTYQSWLGFVNRSRCSLRSKIAEWGKQALVDDFVNFHYFREEAKQKKCLKNLIDSDCNISSANRGVLDLGFADYNPFCANNRDPGTTRKDRCYGVEDISGSAGIEASAAIHATAGIEATTGIYATTGIKTTAVIKATAGFNTAASIKIAVLHTL